MAVVGVLALSLQGASPAHAGPWVLEPKEYYSQVTASLFETQDIFNGDRVRAALFSGAHYSERTLTSYNEFGWRPKLNVVAAVPFKNAHFREDATGVDETQTGLQDLTLGLRYGLARGQTPVGLQVEWQGPMGYNRDLTPALGLGSQGVSGQLLIGRSLPGLRGFVQAAGGYRHLFGLGADTLDTRGAPRDSFALEHGDGSEILFSADAGFWITKRLLLAGRASWLSRSRQGVRLELPRPPNPKTERVETEQILELGPTVIYRVDDALDLVAGSSHTMAGRNTLHTDRFFVGLAFKGTKLTRYQGFMGGTAER
jgi:hypothetical protein